MVKFDPIRLSPGAEENSISHLPPPLEWVSCARFLQTHKGRGGMVKVYIHGMVWYHQKELSSEVRFLEGNQVGFP